MATKFLGKAVAAAAFGGASLLIAAPGIALAGDGGHDGHRKDGWVYAWPGSTTPGSTVTIVEICKKPQEKPWVWSEATGKLWLEPRTTFADNDESADDSATGADEAGESDEGSRWWDRKGDDRKDDWKDKGEDDRKKKHHKLFSDDNGSEESRLDEHTFYGSADVMPEYEPMATYRDDPKEGQRDRGDHDKWGHDHKDKKFFSDEWDRKDHKDKRDHKDHKNKGDRDGKHHKHHDKRDKDKKYKKHPWAYFAEAELSYKLEPGVYELVGSCGEGKLIVTPKGSVDAGSGLATGADSALLTGGAGMLAAALLGGTALLRRRTADGSLA